MDLKDPKQITKLSFRLLQIVSEVGKEVELSDKTLDTISARIRQIQSGLSQESEFIAVINWLGRCVSANRIDQLPLPSTTKK